MAQKNSTKLNPKKRSPLKIIFQWPWASFLLVGLMALVFVMEQRAQNVGVLVHMIHDFDFNWANFLSQPIEQAPRLISHLFFHGDAGHIISNVIFFLIFAPSVESRIGSLWFVASFLIWGVIAALSQGFFTPFSNGLIGASGAISGAAGAFFVLYPLKAPPYFLAAVLGGWIRFIPAFFWIGLYFLNQLWLGLYSLTPEALSQEISRIGYWAHIGGFLAGALTMAPVVFRKKD